MVHLGLADSDAFASAISLSLINSQISLCYNDNGYASIQMRLGLAVDFKRIPFFSLFIYIQFRHCRRSSLYFLENVSG